MNCGVDNFETAEACVAAVKEEAPDYPESGVSPEVGCYDACRHAVCIELYQADMACEKGYQWIPDECANLWQECPDDYS
jgi:hypothetical protein